MPIATLIFEEPLNSSIQIDDIIYYSTVSTSIGSNVPQVTLDGANPIVNFGVVNDIIEQPPTLKVNYDSSVAMPQNNDYIMFEKDKRVNSSSLIGYYARVKLSNDSKSKIELFSLGSETSESSK